MQPETPRVPSGPELVPINVAPGGENIPVLPTPETGIQAGGEHYEQAAEAGAIAAGVAAPALPFQQLPTQGVADPTTTLVTDDTPAVAADEDVIEKEWVDKAKKILDETKDDPFQRSQRVNELQRAYLKKRYNKDLGSEQ